MHKFHYRAGKAAVAGLISGAIALFMGWTYVSDADSDWFTLAIALVCGVAAIKVALDSMSDTPALAFDGSGVRLRRTWGTIEDVEWSEVQSIDVEVYTVRYYGIIPVSRTENLVVKCEGGLFGSRRLRLSLKMLELPSGGAAHLLAMMHAAHVAAVGEAAAAMAGADRQQGWGARSAGFSARPKAPETAAESGFDPDAALARYLSRKDSGSGADVAAVGAPPPPVAPARPVFGRKTQAG